MRGPEGGAGFAEVGTTEEEMASRAGAPAPPPATASSEAALGRAPCSPTTARDGLLRRVRIATVTGESPVRREWNAERVAELVAARRLILPILVTADLRLVDGAYRLAAARQLGWESIDALVVDAPDEAARIAAACRVNDVERLSRAERRMAAARLLELEPTWSDRRVARITGTSPSSVGAWRAKMDTSGVHLDASGVQSDTRIGSDGKRHSASRPRTRVGWLRRLLRRLGAWLRRHRSSGRGSTPRDLRQPHRSSHGQGGGDGHDQERVTPKRLSG